MQNLTYDKLETMAATRKRKLANNTYLETHDDGSLGVRLHKTEVVRHYPDRTVLNSGGWQTVTTKERMNTFSDHAIYSERGVWYVSPCRSYRVGGPAPLPPAVPFADDITIYADGRVENKGDDPAATRKLRKAVNQYATDYADAIIAGSVPPPGPGDCWACCMVTDNGAAPMGGPDHIHLHMNEKYYVPSILTRCEDQLSPMTKDFIARQWGGTEKREPLPGGRGESHEHETVRRAVRRFCLRELGLSV